MTVIDPFRRGDWFLFFQKVSPRAPSAHKEGGAFLLLALDFERLYKIMSNVNRLLPKPQFKAALTSNWFCLPYPRFFKESSHFDLICQTYVVQLES